MTYWFCLFFAGVLEVAWAFFLKKSEGFKILQHTILFAITVTLCLVFLGFAIEGIPMSIAYPIWTGIGTVGSVLLGIFAFKEVVKKRKFIFLAFIIVGIIGLKVIS